jgi:hypothetical protein
MRQRGEAAGQRVLVEQPVAHPGGRLRMQLGAGQPARRMGKGSVGHEGQSPQNESARV